jgi:hypothetical protein
LERQDGVDLTGLTGLRIGTHKMLGEYLMAENRRLLRKAELDRVT